MKTLNQTQLEYVSGGYASMIGDLLRGEPMPPMQFPLGRNYIV